MVSWLKDGQPLDTKKVNIRNSDNDSIIFIRTAQREDSGVYEMAVKVDSFEDKAAVTLQIVGELCMTCICLHGLGLAWVREHKQAHDMHTWKQVCARHVYMSGLFQTYMNLCI